MDTIDGMRTFVAVVSEGSFSRAAERLELSPQLVSKYVSQLEARLGVRLMNRSTRRLSLTEAGRAYVDRCRQILADLADMESAVGDMSAKARGELRINAPMSFGVTHLSPAIAAYQQQQPDVTVDLSLNDRVVDVVSEGYDIGIRIAQLEPSTLVARKLAPVHLAVCASPDYLTRAGVPQTPEDLSMHECLRYAYWAEQDQWLFSRDGETQKIRVKGSFSANNGDALRLAALAGRGLVLQPTFIVADDLRAGRLQQVLGDYALRELGLYAVYAHRQYLSAKVRTFIDFLVDYFGSPPYWDR